MDDRSPHDRTLLEHWVGQGLIEPARAPEAFALVAPTAAHWRRFIHRLLLANGMTLALAGIVFFFAFNWQHLSRFHKFGLVQALLVTVLAARQRWSQRPVGRAFLMAAAVLTGVLLALVGQTYQTGADTWQLFAGWALLILPWVVLGQSGALWLLWLFLLNLSLVLYYQTFAGLFGVFFGRDALFWSLCLLNGAAQAGGEWALRRDWLRGRSEVRMLALASGAAITWLALGAILGSGQAEGFTVLAYGGWLALVYRIYRRWIPDLFMLAGAALSLILTSTAVLAESLFRGHDGDGLLVLALWVLGTSVAAVRWLRALAQEGGHD